MIQAVENRQTHLDFIIESRTILDIKRWRSTRGTRHLYVSKQRQEDVVRTSGKAAPEMGTRMPLAFYQVLSMGLWGPVKRNR